MLVLILGGIFLLGITIVVHELGHLLLGKLVGVKAEIFSIGYGKGIWKKKLGDTTLQITAFPLGGYVKFKGDDYSVDYNNESNQNQGDFFSKPPLVRIIPVLGGPLFNLILGFLIFFIVGFFPSYSPPSIYFWEELENSPAKTYGLQKGDLVLEVNQKKIKNFRELQEHILLSGGAPLHLKVQRETGIYDITVIPETDSAGRSFLGIRIPGERYIQVDFPFVKEIQYRILNIFQKDLEPPVEFPAMRYLQDGDILLEVEGRKIHSTYELQMFLGSLDKDQVRLKIKRQKYPFWIPWITEIKEIEVPIRKEYRIYFKNLEDMKYKETLEQIELVSYSTEHMRLLNFIKVNNKPVSSFKSLYEEYSKAQPVSLTIQNNEYRATIIAQKIGLMGFRPSSLILTKKVENENSSILDALIFSIKNTYDQIALYPKFFEKLFSGRISFLENTMGPVGMFAVAGIVMQTDLLDYFQLMASISIALMVINLFPFPIVDGGHILLFLIEAIRGKKLPLNFIEGLHRFAFLFLVGLGLWIMFKDVLFVLGL
ncbi:MAG: site-2 protease family protein [Leptonema sp. (in: bacteria)]